MNELNTVINSFLIKILYKDIGFTDMHFNSDS